jgi:chemotaxis protein methyltransferase CheR
MKSVGESNLQVLLDKVLEKGINLAQYKSDFLRRRLAVRLRARGTADYLRYSHLLDEDPSEYAALFKALSINVTEFFRDSDVFDAFGQKVIPKLCTEKHSIRVWSAGCATGEEAYSVAIMLKEHTNIPFKVLATDMSASAVERARRGRYHDSALKNLPSNILDKYFRSVGNEYEVSREIRDSVRLNVGDLANCIAPVNLAAIFCRNVLMYFNRELQHKLVARFHHSLLNHGYFVLGKSEAIMGRQSALFEPVMPKERIFRKRQ